MVGALIRREKFGLRHLGEAARPQRAWSDASTSRGRARMTRNHQKLEEARKDSFLEPSEGAWTHWHLDLGLLASRALREHVSVCSHIFGNSLRQP